MEQRRRGGPRLHISRPLLHPRRAPSSPTPSFHSGFQGNTAPLPPFRVARVDLPASPKAQQEAAEPTPGFPQGRGPAPLRPTALPAGSRPPHRRRRVSPRRDRAPRAPSFPHGGRTTAVTYGAGKMSPFGRRRPRSRPRCRSRCSAPPAGPPGSAGRAGGAPTMPRAPSRHIHRPPLTARVPHGAARSIALPHHPLTVSPRSTHNPSRSSHGSPHDPSRLGHGCHDPGGCRGCPGFPPALPAPRRSWPGSAVEKPGPCVGLGFGTAASAAAAGRAIVYKRVRSQIFRTGRSERGILAVFSEE